MKSKINDAEKLAVEITFEALCKIIGENYAAESFRRAVIENVISSLKDLSDLKVHVNPNDISAVSSLSDKIGYSDVTFVADDRVGKGGCIVESSSGSWDGRLETQLQRLKETLVGVIKSDELGA
ncbi:MAG: hypothetical protein JKY01_03040 [Pseudomonadales bacterium]|nr:hypothetical protein [Pseudomonadales bacterium]